MKILVVSPKNKTVFNFRGDLIKDMIACGNEVVVTGPNRDFVEEIDKLGVSKFREVPLVKDNTSVFGDLKYCGKLVKVMRDEKPDMVFSYTIKPVVYGSIAAKLSGVKHVNAMVTGLGRVYGKKSIKARLIRIITKILYKTAFLCCDKVIFQNNDDINEFVSSGYLPEKKAVKVDGSGVNMERFVRKPLPEKPVFLMVGRIIKEKGVLDYCEAARIVKKKYNDAEFVLLGGFDSSLGALKREDISQYIDDGSIIFPGEVKDPAEFYGKCSVFVLPSYYREGLPRTILEAMSCARAVITTDSTGCRDPIIDGENGFLIQPGDYNELANKMICLIEDRQLLENMAEKSYERCKSVYEVGVVNKKMREYLKY